MNPDTLLRKFDKDFRSATVGGEERWRLGFLNLMISRGHFSAFVREIHQFIDRFVEEAIEYRKSLSIE